MKSLQFGSTFFLSFFSIFLLSRVGETQLVVIVNHHHPLCRFRSRSFFFQSRSSQGADGIRIFLNPITREGGNGAATAISPFSLSLSRPSQVVYTLGWPLSFCCKSLIASHETTWIHFIPSSSRVSYHVKTRHVKKK
jgi:hypothetical protein